MGGTLFYWMTTENSKMLPSPLKYSRCPSTDGETLRKPPITVYGGLRSRLGIITFVFTRQGTQTTGRWPGTRPIPSEPAMGADHSPPSNSAPSPRVGENTTPCRAGWGLAEKETRPVNPTLGLREDHILKSREEGEELLKGITFYLS